MVNFHLVCDPNSTQLDWVLTFLGNSGLNWTIFAWNRNSVVPVEENGNLQILICVLVARPTRCHTLSNPVLWQSWTTAYLCRWRDCFLADQLWLMTRIQEEKDCYYIMNYHIYCCDVWFYWVRWIRGDNVGTRGWNPIVLLIVCCATAICCFFFKLCIHCVIVCSCIVLVLESLMGFKICNRLVCTFSRLRISHKRSAVQYMG